MSDAVCVTVDVEGDFGGDALRGVDDVLPRLLDVFDTHAVRAVFFVVGTVAQRRPDAVRTLVSRGHVVGSHTMHHRALSTLAANDRDHELAASRDCLAAITDTPCVAFRAPYFDAPDDLGPALERHGYRWSSSKAPFSPRAGYRHLAASRAVHTLAGSAVVEVPVPCIGAMPMPDGLSYRRVFHPLGRLGGSPPRVFYLHPYDLLATAEPSSGARWLRALSRVRGGAWAWRELETLLGRWTDAGARFVPPEFALG